jgi:hypothetical protein
MGATADATAAVAPWALGSLMMAKSLGQAAAAVVVMVVKMADCDVCVGMVDVVATVVVVIVASAVACDNT